MAKQKTLEDDTCEVSDTKSTESLKIGIKIIATIITLISAFLIIYTLANQESLQNEFSIQIENYGIPSLFALSLLLDLIPQLISPIMILGAGILAGMNVHYAVLITMIGSTIGSTLGFIIGKRYMCKAVHLTMSEEKRLKLRHFTNKYGKIVVPITAISPLPYLPILLGAMNFSKKNFLLYGVVPRILSFILFGYFIKAI